MAVRKIKADSRKQLKAHEDELAHFDELLKEHERLHVKDKKTDG